jgi:endonuclease/exonuclease/phosphatase family metal-dependent hydrolase
MSPGVLRIASYNIHRCVGRDGRSDPQRAAEVIRELNCEVVGLQEVDNDDTASPPTLRLEGIARAAGMQAVPGLQLMRHIGHYGNALLTRLPVQEVQRHDLSYHGREPRAVLDVRLRSGAGPLRVMVTHLGLLPWERRFQVKKILQITAAAPPEQTIVLLGDINEWWPRGRPLRWLHAQFGCPPHARSFPAAWPLFALDRIWVKPRTALLEVRAHRSALARAASDHLPVVGHLAL